MVRRNFNFPWFEPIFVFLVNRTHSMNEKPFFQKGLLEVEKLVVFGGLFLNFWTKLLKYSDFCDAQNIQKFQNFIILDFKKWFFQYMIFDLSILWLLGARDLFVLECWDYWPYLFLKPYSPKYRFLASVIVVLPLFFDLHVLKLWNSPTIM